MSESLAARPLRSRFFLCFILFLGFGFCAGAGAGAEELWSDSGFYVDLPEGFTLGDGDGSTRFSFIDPMGGMEFDILGYEASRHADAKALATELLGKLGSQGEVEAFSYEGRDAVFAELAFALNGGPKRGFAIFLGGRKKSGGTAGVGGKAAPPPPEHKFALLAYAEEAAFDSYADFILSCLDAFSIDRAARRSPGPLSQYLLPFPAERRESKKVSFGGTSIELPWSSEEAAQVEGTAGREFRVLEAYGQTEDLWKAAWARTYRMIFRESARRLDRLSLEIDRLLPEDPTDASRAMLEWVQGYRYERDPEGIDFVEPLSAAYESRGDCDSRAMVMAIVLERRGIDVILMLSRDFAHAGAGVDVPGGGQRFPWEGKDWLYAETTAKVGLGMIAEKQADWSKWIGVSFGD